jgi:hypothetical protein
LGQLDEHLQQARDNRRLANALLNLHASDLGATTWAVTLAFYAAVHCIEACFARRGEHSGDHGGRESLMVQARFGIPERVFTTYRLLEEWSRNGRYKHQTYSAEFVRSRALPALKRITDFSNLDA